MNNYSEHTFLDRHLCSINAAPLEWSTACPTSWGTEGMLQGRQLCLLHVPPTVSRSLRDLGLGLNSGYSPYSLPTEECAASAFVARSGSTRRGAKPICLLRAWPGAATVGHGGAGGISCYGLSALTAGKERRSHLHTGF